MNALLFVALLLAMAPASPAPATPEAPPSDEEEDVVSDRKELAALHLVDAQGLAMVLDIGDHEIVIDGGGDPDALADYLAATHLVQPPIELVVVSHAHYDHYRGLRNVLARFPVSEVWDPGYDSSGREYKALLDQIHALRSMNLIRPLSGRYPAAVDTGVPQPFKLPSMPEVTVTVLSAKTRPIPSLWGPLEGNPNTTSIVLKLEYDSVAFLFPGDALGKERSGRAESPSNEEELLKLEQAHPGTLRADVLVAPHHGSESASTSEFIDAVGPKIVLFAALGRFGLPFRTTTSRYDRPWRQLFETSQDKSRKRNVIVRVLDTGTLHAQYRASSVEGVRWEGTLRGGEPITEDELKEYCNDNGRRRRLNPRQPIAARADAAAFDRARLAHADLSGLRLPEAELSDLDMAGTNLSGAVLTNARFGGTELVDASLAHANLEGATASRTMRGVDLSDVWWPKAPMIGANLANATLSYAKMAQADFSGAILSAAKLDYFSMRGGTLKDTKLDEAVLAGADLTDTLFEPFPAKGPSANDLILAPYLATFHYHYSPHGLIELKEAFKKAGLRQQERDVTYSIEHERRLASPRVERYARYWLFELPTLYGRAANRPLAWILALIAICSVAYYSCIVRNGKSDIKLVARIRSRKDPAALRERVFTIRLRGARVASLANGVHVTRWRAARIALAFSIVNALNLKVQFLDAGVWLRMLRSRNYDIEGTGWARSISGAQSLVSMYLLALWILMYLGNPFD
jgi:beta-lactamase superfamily II metal-dependent hydrolase/uncharacterized protein YjbI with pentapeptide repeats